MSFFDFFPLLPLSSVVSPCFCLPMGLLNHPLSRTLIFFSSMHTSSFSLSVITNSYTLLFTSLPNSSVVCIDLLTYHSLLLRNTGYLSSGVETMLGREAECTIERG